MQRPSSVGPPSDSPVSAGQIAEPTGLERHPFASFRESLAGGTAAPEERPSPTSAMPAASPAPPLGFNCPACGVVLVIHVREAYDGGPAPCPRCGARVLPPRVVTASTERIDLHPLPGLSEQGEFPSKAPRALHRGERPPHRLIGAIEDFEGLLASFE